ncbi:hypothetical protein [Actinomadura opuntiae]|uniref:hypothetical protein n=1 Tax=Actinomadura sp. OS1-43 TaxID=604315 RepID=UPI00255B1542|nr:hypothetical protein [Actinomadura sp. OS1-43]MDL4819319.1 hypothetical protein [Actinomadura sp. OS1-43]
MEPKAFTSSPVVWLVTEDIHLIRADTITGIGVTGEQLTVWQGDRATTVVQAGVRPQFSARHAGLLAQCLAAAVGSPPLDRGGKPFPLVYVWLYLDDAEDPCWQVGVAGGDEDSEPPFSASALA